MRVKYISKKYLREVIIPATNYEELNIFTKNKRHTIFLYRPN